jgi:hypothetical protein
MQHHLPDMYVTSFPIRGRKWQVSKDGGAFSEWSPLGDELFYLDPQNVLMTVPVALDQESFTHGGGSTLFQTGIDRSILEDPYTVSPDGQRFLMIERQENAAPSLVNLLVGWDQLIEQRNP